ncbi:MAG: hypothetical protein GY754_23240 [bacterium]|nr:hypothetical protein [bacterium]
MKASSILFVILAATAAAASLSAGGYFVYSNINKPLVETKAEPVGVVEKTEKEIEKLPVVVKSPKTEKRIRIKIEPEGMNSLVFSRTEEIIKKSFRSWKGDRFANSQIVGDAIKSDDDGDETVFISIRLIVNTVKDGKIKSAQFIVLDTNFKNDTVMLNKLPGELKNRVDKFKNKVK